MRESAQRADSEVTESEDSHNFSSDLNASGYAEFSGLSPEFPSAMQALRTKPRHLALFMGLPRKSSRNSASLRFASLSRSGRKNEAFSAGLRESLLNFRG